MSDSKQLRLNNLRGHLRTKTLEYLDTWEALHADVKYIHDLSRGNKLKGKRSTQARQIEALAIMFWAQKHKAPLEQCCDDHEMIRQLARRLYFFAGKCNRKDTTLFAKIGLRWHDIFPSWIPSSIKAFVKLITLASSVAGLAIMKKRPRKEAQEELKALAATAPQATEPTANIIGGILARFEAHKNAIIKSDDLSGMSELGAALEEENLWDDEDEDEDDDEEGGVDTGGGESQESAVQTPKLHKDLPFRPA